MAGYQMQGGTAMQGMTMTPAALAAAQMAAQSGQLPKANSAQLQQQLVAGGVAPGNMAMPAATAAAAAVPGMPGKMGTPGRPTGMQPMVAGAMPHAGEFWLLGLCMCVMRLDC
jgi:hypothetical protein